jgi:hypothetical protein
VHKTQKTQTFVIRFWQDSQWDDVTEWRGLVIHVQSGERIPVRSRAEAADVISTFLNDVSSPPLQAEDEE